MGLGESLWLPGSAADRKAERLSCVAYESGSQRPRPVRRWLEPSLLNGASAERRGLDRFYSDIGMICIDLGINIGGAPVEAPPLLHIRNPSYLVIT